MTTKNSSDKSDPSSRNFVALSVLLIGILVTIFIGIAISTGPASALFPINNFTAIDEAAIVNPSGQNIEVTGTTQCTGGEIVKVNVRVEQSGVEAFGQTRERCLGEEIVLHWDIRATTYGPSSFESSEDAHVWAEARTFSKGKETDFHDWDEDVIIVERDR